MRRDVMESAGLAIFAEIGIILFFFAFALVFLRVFLMKKSDAEEASRIPLDDGVQEEGS